MKITLNGIEHEAKPAWAVLDLVRQELGDEAPKGVAVALNGEVVRRTEWPSVKLTQGDVIEIVRAKQGG